MIGATTVLGELVTSPRTHLVLLASLGLLVISTAYVREGDLFSPLGFLGLAYLMGWFGPAVDYAVRGDPSGILLGNGLEYLVRPMAMSVGAVILTVGGYSLQTGRTAAKQLPRPSLDWDGHRVKHVLGVCLIVGVSSLIIFVYTTGGIPSSLSGISRKRFPATEYLRWGTSLLQVAAIVYLVHLTQAVDSVRPQQLITVGGLILIGCITPFLSSDRSGLLWFLVLVLVVYHYAWYRIRPTVLAGNTFDFLLVASLMALLRRIAWDSEATLAVLPEYVLSVRAVEAIIGARNNGISIVAHIYHRVPAQLAPAYGESLLYPVVFPIPRQLWPSKPKNVGQFFGETIYAQGIGAPGGGVPPSLVGELYYNFLLPGVVVGAILFGVLLRFGYEYFRPTVTDCVQYVVLYGVFAIYLGNQLFLGQATSLFKAILVGAIYGVAFAYISVPTEHWHAAVRNVR